MPWFFSLLKKSTLSLSFLLPASDGRNFHLKERKKGIKGCVAVVFSSDGRPGNENERFPAPQRPAFTSVCPSLRAPRSSQMPTPVISVFFFVCFVFLHVRLCCVFFHVEKGEKNVYLSAVCLVSTLRRVKTRGPLPPSVCSSPLAMASREPLSVAALWGPWGTKSSNFLRKSCICIANPPAGGVRA